MDVQILIGLLLTVLPVFELRGGLPVIVEYATRKGISVWPYFFVVLILNILMIFVVFFFLDFLHEHFMKIRVYRKFMDKFLERVRRKADKVQKKMDNFGFLGLALFIAIPLPGTGVWTGTLVAWFLGLKRWKSIVAIGCGVVIAGLIVLSASFGFFNGF